MPATKTLTTKQKYDRARYVRLKAKREAEKPPDVIELLSAIDLAYIAGIIDGEGSIYIGAVGPERRRSVYPNIVVAMTSRGVLEWLSERLGTGTLKLHNQTALRRNPHYKTQWRVHLFGKTRQSTKSAVPRQARASP
jgi:hypothetical protein